MRRALVRAVANWLTFVADADKATDSSRIAFTSRVRRFPARLGELNGGKFRSDSPVRLARASSSARSEGVT